MKRIVLKAPKQFAVEETAVPRPGPGEALVKVRLVGVCGSDMHLYRHGRIGEIALDRPLVIGHECMGTVAEIGKGADKALAGRRVAIEPQDFCGKCRWCLAGLQNMCPTHTFLGLPPRDGAMQEYLVHPAHLLEPLPDSLSEEAAVALEPVAIALHAVKLSKVRPGQKVAILGTGVLGTCILLLLGLYEGLETVAVDLVGDRLERAEALGAKTVHASTTGDRSGVARSVREVTGGDGADVVFECAGVEETLYNMCEVAAPGAHVVVVGSNPGDRVEFSSGTARRKGLTMRFVRRSLNTLPAVIDLATRGLVAPEKIITHTFAASEAAEAFELVGDYADGVLKAVIDMEKW